MKFTTATLLLAAHQALAQTPANSFPSTSGHLDVNYGSTVVSPGNLLPRSLVATEPTISSPTKLNGTYMVALLDLSISGSNFNGTSLPLAKGLEPCRTTRLHWLQTGLTQRANGSLVAGSSAAIAEYGGPMPPLNDIPHTYTFYLFPQPSNFSLPAYDSGRDLFAASASDRMNFSVSAIADVVGSPILGNYIRVQNPGNNATGSYANGTCPTNLVGGGGNATSTGAAPAATYAGAASSVEGLMGGMMIVGGAVAFALM